MKIVFPLCTIYPKKIYNSVENLLYIFIYLQHFKMSIYKIYSRNFMVKNYQKNSENLLLYTFFL